MSASSRCEMLRLAAGNRRRDRCRGNAAVDADSRCSASRRAPRWRSSNCADESRGSAARAPGWPLRGGSPVLPAEARARRRIGRRGGQRLGLAAQRPVERVDDILGSAEAPRERKPRHSSKGADGLETEPLERSDRVRGRGASAETCKRQRASRRHPSSQMRGCMNARAPRPPLRSARSRHGRSVRAARSRAGYRRTSPRSPPNRCATPLTSSRSPSSRRPRPAATSARPSARAARAKRHRRPDRPEPRPAPDRARAHRSAARPARAPRSAAAFGDGMDERPVRRPRRSGRPARQARSRALFAQRSIARCGKPDGSSTRFMRDAPPARRMPARAEQVGVPCRRSRRARVERIGQRRRARDPPAHPRPAEIRSAAQPHQPAAATRLRSAATASRRVAVKSSAVRVAPDFADDGGRARRILRPPPSPTARRGASRASTWMRSLAPSPGGWTRPLSRIAIRSCTHSKGLPVPSCASRNPAQPPSRGCAANSSDRVGLGGAGKLPALAQPARGAGRVSGRTSFRRRRPGKGLPPHDSQHSVLLLFFIPRLRWRRVECAANFGRRCLADWAIGGLPSISVRKVPISRDDPAQRRPPQHGAHMMGVDLDRLVDLMRQPARGARRDDAVAPRPESQRRHRRLAHRARKRRLVDVVARRSARRIRGRWCWSCRSPEKGEHERHHRAHLVRMHDAPARARTCRQGSSRPAAPAGRRRSRRAAGRAVERVLLAPRLSPSSHG